MKSRAITCKFPIRHKLAAAAKRPVAVSVVTRAARLLALAHHIERLIEAGELAGYAEAARALGLTRARLTQVMNLLLLAPEIQERVLVGNLTVTEHGLRSVAKTPRWRDQQDIAINLTQAQSDPRPTPRSLRN